MNKIVKNALILMAFSLVLGFVLGAVYKITEGPIAEANKRKEMEAYKRIGWSCFPSAAKARLSGIFEKSATRLVGLPIGSSCPKGTKK